MKENSETNEKRIHAVFIPSMAVSQEFQFDLGSVDVLQPMIIDAGNFKDAKTRFYPVITAKDTESHHLQFILFKISVDYEHVNITVRWQFDLPQPEGTPSQMRAARVRSQTEAHSLCTNNECCAFIRGSSIYYIRYESGDMKLKCIRDVYASEWFEPNGSIYLVHDVVFYTFYPKSADEYDGEGSYGARKSLMKLNFDGIHVPVVDCRTGVNVPVNPMRAYIYEYMTRVNFPTLVSIDVPMEEQRIQHICDYVSLGSIHHRTGDIVGRNLYKSQRTRPKPCCDSESDDGEIDSVTTMLFLDQNIENNHLYEREMFLNVANFGVVKTTS